MIDEDIIKVGEDTNATRSTVPKYGISTAWRLLFFINWDIKEDIRMRDVRTTKKVARKAHW